MGMAWPMGLGARPMGGAARARSHMGPRALAQTEWWLGMGDRSLALLMAVP